MLIAKFVDAENGMESVVMQFGAAKFHAILRDTDAGEVVGVRIYADADAATKYAAGLLDAAEVR
jgi:hypothetical protein